MNPPDDVLRQLLTGASTIAIVGLSEKPDRDSNGIARYFQSHGYRIVPINPAVAEILGERSYATLTEIPPEVRVDLAVVFRRPDAVPAIVDEAIGRGIPAVWMQLGIAHPESAAKARARGLLVVEDACAMTAHRRLQVPPKRPEARHGG